MGILSLLPLLALLAAGGATSARLKLRSSHGTCHCNLDHVGSRQARCATAAVDLRLSTAVAACATAATRRPAAAAVSSREREVN